jgi:hypothetical protein
MIDLPGKLADRLLHKFGIFLWQVRRGLPRSRSAPHIAALPAALLGAPCRGCPAPPGGCSTPPAPPTALPTAPPIAPAGARAGHRPVGAHLPGRGGAQFRAASGADHLPGAPQPVHARGGPVRRHLGARVLPGRVGPHAPRLRPGDQVCGCGGVGVWGCVGVCVGVCGGVWGCGSVGPPPGGQPAAAGRSAALRARPPPARTHDPPARPAPPPRAAGTGPSRRAARGATCWRSWPGSALHWCASRRAAAGPSSCRAASGPTPSPCCTRTCTLPSWTRSGGARCDGRRWPDARRRARCDERRWPDVQRRRAL